MKLFTGWKLFLLSIALVIPFIGWSCTRITKDQHFDDAFTYHFNNALSSDNIDYSCKEVDIAMNYIESHNLTSGYTTISGVQASEDIAYWYNGVKEQADYMHSLKNETPEIHKKQLEYVQHKVLEPKHISVPPGISVYPYNTLYMVWCIISALLALLSIIGIIVFVDERSHS